MKKLHSTWSTLKKDYKLTEVIAQGSSSSGQIVKGRHRQSNLEVAIKKIDCSTDDGNLSMSYVLREVMILRKLSECSSEMDGSCQYTTKLYDVIMHENTQLKSVAVFLVMEYVGPCDMTRLLTV